MAIRIIKPGFTATLQDLGRCGQRATGVPVSGAMDSLSMRVANLLCGNPQGATVVENTMHGQQWLCEEDLLMAYCGGGSCLSIDGKQISPGRMFWAKANAMLRFEASSIGRYTYVAIAGGCSSRIDFGSSSTYTVARLGGLCGDYLQAGDQLLVDRQHASPAQGFPKSESQELMQSKGLSWGVDLSGILWADEPIRCMPGPERDWFDSKQSDAFFKSEYMISAQSNRMGFRLSGPSVRWEKQQELLSTAVTQGTVQVTHDGSLLVLMADAQTTGGYPRIAQVAAVDIPRLAQMSAGHKFRFKEISWQEAEDLYLMREKWVQQLATAIVLKKGDPGLA